MSLYSGPFFESSLLPWQGYTVSVIRSGLCSTGCYFNILTNLLQNISHASRETTVIFVRSFKKLLRNTSTAAIRSVALRAFDAEIAGKSFYCIFHVMAVGFVPHVILKDARSGASGCGRNSSLMFLTARSSSPFPRCCGSFSSTTARFSPLFVSAGKKQF